MQHPVALHLLWVEIQASPVGERIRLPPFSLFHGRIGRHGLPEPPPGLGRWGGFGRREGWAGTDGRKVWASRGHGAAAGLHLRLDVAGHLMPRIGALDNDVAEQLQGVATPSS